MPQITAEDREAFRAAARAVDDAQLSVSSRSRSFRNTLTVTILALGAIAILFPAFAAKADPRLLDLHPATTQASPTPTPTSSSAPTSESTPATGQTIAPTTPPSTPSNSAPTAAPSSGSPAAQSQTESASTSTAGAAPTTDDKTGWGAIASIELWGVLGALVGAIAGLRNLRGSTQPVGLQLAQIALKIPAGALTALAGVILLQAALTPTTQPVPVGKVAAVAIIFGAAQEALTAFVDRTAGNILDKGGTLGEKTTQTP
jgi:hypothetical protein